MKLITKISRKLQTLGWYPFETLASSNAFVSSVFVNFILLAIILIWTHFSNFNMRGDLIGYEIAATQIFGFIVSLINWFKFKKFKKAYEVNKTHTKEEREEYEESNALVGFLFYWIVGTVIAYFIMVPPFAVCKLLF